ncbi:hypothetical protein ACIK7D_15045 [Agrobacterium sp. P15N1-A]
MTNPTSWFAKKHLDFQRQIGGDDAHDFVFGRHDLSSRCNRGSLDHTIGRSVNRGGSKPFFGLHQFLLRFIHLPGEIT